MQQKASTRMQTVSVPKLMLLAALIGIVLGLIAGLLPATINWNGELYEMIYLKQIIKFLFIVTVVPLVVHLYRNKKFEWLRKAEYKSK